MAHRHRRPVVLVVLLAIIAGGIWGLGVFDRMSVRLAGDDVDAKTSNYEKIQHQLDVQGLRSDVTEGHGAGLLNVTPSPVESGIVVLMASVVFGLSTDYEVFLLSRMVEASADGSSTEDAVRTGVSPAPPRAEFSGAA